MAGRIRTPSSRAGEAPSKANAWCGDVKLNAANITGSERYTRTDILIRMF
jgi:hypothetical protein